MTVERLRRLAAKLPRLRTVSSTRRYSVVSAVHDVEPYLDAFLGSLARQSLDFDRHIELILVDDGSRDRSGEIIRRWQAAHPRAIRYLRKENGGQASARNLGLEHATGDWVTFADPDDFVDGRYFEHVDALLSRPDAHDVVMVGCKLLVHRGGRSRDEHALRSQFQDGDRILTGEARDAQIQLHAASTFFRRDLLRAHGLRFDERVRPVFEDGHLVGRYRLANRDGAIAFCARARYHYRKRDDRSSTVDRSWAHPGRFGAVIEHGYVGLLAEAAASSAGRRAPVWAQRTVLYELLWYLRMLVDRPEATAFLTPAQSERFRTLLGECFEHIDATTIERFDLGGFGTEDAVGLLGRFKGSAPASARVIVDAYDGAKRSLRIRSFDHGVAAPEELLLDGATVAPSVVKTRRRDLLGAPFVHERIRWIAAPDVDRALRVRIGAEEAVIEVPRLGARTAWPVRALAETLGARPRLADVAWYHRAEHRLGTSRLARLRYRDALLFLDRDTQADDNAEHLYRYVRQARPDLNAFFVLRRSSRDWPRLEREGFRLIAFGSIEHRLALLNARHLVSSHAEHFVLGWPTVRHRRELQRSRFTFLQHGVIKDDLSGWLNTKDIDCFVTSSPAERASIVESGSPYKLTSREVVLTGLPRHDALASGDARPERILLVAPTWRQSLVGETIGKSSARRINPAFFESDFALRWKRLVHSDALEAIARRHGFQVRLLPHPNLEPYLGWFELPSWVEPVTREGGTSVQASLRTAAVMLTDYSSVAFDVAYLRRAIVYYQFDRERTFGGGHTTRPGYYDYDRDGFGPVCLDEPELLRELDRSLSSGGAPEPAYLDRMARALPLRDGQCARRTLDAMLDLDRT